MLSWIITSMLSRIVASMLWDLGEHMFVKINPAALWAMSRLDPSVESPIQFHSIFIQIYVPQSLKGEVYLSLLSLSRGSGRGCQKVPWIILGSKMRSETHPKNHKTTTPYKSTKSFPKVSKRLPGSPKRPKDVTKGHTRPPEESPRGAKGCPRPPNESQKGSPGPPKRPQKSRITKEKKRKNMIWCTPRKWLPICKYHTILHVRGGP